MSSPTVNSECNLLLLWPTAFRQRSLASLAWRCGLLSPRRLSSSIASPRNMSAARRAHVSMTSARGSANKASISKRLNGAPRLNCRMSSCRARPERRIPLSFAALMVHVDVEHDSEQRVELAIGLADRFQAALIGVAGCALWPAFMAGDVELSKSSQYDFQRVMVRFEQKGKTFRAQGRSLRQIEWRSALESPGELLLREARAADLLVIGRRRSGDEADPGVIVLRAGRPVLLVPDTAAALP